MFCENCEKVVQHIFNSYLELVQVQLRLSWKLGELEMLIENSQNSDAERTQELANNLGILDAAKVENIRELLSVRCEHMSKKFQPQLVLKRNEALNGPFKLQMSGINAIHSKTDQTVKKEVESSPENCDNDWNPADDDDDEVASNEDATSFSASTSSTTYNVILMDTQIKMENDDYFDVEDEMCAVSDPGSDWSLTSTEKSKRTRKSASGRRKAQDKEISNSEAEEDGLERQCCFCWRSFQTAQSQSRHVKSVHANPTRTFPCEVKEWHHQFSSHLELNTHLKSHSPELLRCQVCGWGLLDADILKLHELVHIKSGKVGGKRRKLCPESNCGLRFRTVALLQDHYNIRHGVSLKRFRCSECPHVSTSSKALWTHTKFHHLGKPIKGCQLPKKLLAATTVSLVSCEVGGCLEMFEGHLQLNSHLETHSKSINFCKDCGFGFIDMNLLKLHELTHLKLVKADGMKDGMYHCPETACLIQTNSIPKLQDHYNTRHGISLKRYKCGQCEYVGASSHSLKNHMQRRHDEIKRILYLQRQGPKQCVPCGLQLNNKTAFARHRRRFHLRKECGICNETFTGQLELMKHVKKTHHNQRSSKIETKTEMKFPCVSCEKVFPTLARLELHKKSGHGEKVHKCEICNTMFRTKARVTNHRIKYHDSKPCLHCGKRFTGAEAVIRHILNNHLEKAATEDGTHVCPHCPLRYNRKNYMHRHIWNCHPDAPENLKCSKCQLKLERGRENDMEQHELTHMTEEERKLQRKVHICHICGQEFPLLKDFNNHAHESNE